MKETKFGQRLKELRVQSGITQQGLSEIINVHRTTIKDWEVRGKEPNYATLCKIAQYFEVTVDYLLGIDS